MSHMVQITNVGRMGIDTVILEGTVDGTPLTTTAWWDNDTSPSDDERKDYFRECLRDAYIAQACEEQPTLIDTTPIPTAVVPPPKE